MTFAKIENEDGSVAVFELRNSAFISNNAGDSAVLKPGIEQLEPLAVAVAGVAHSLRTKLSPDSLAVEVGIGLSAEVGWFIAKSQLEGSIKVTLTWKGDSTE